MGKYILKRIAFAIPLILLILTINWLIIRTAPGDPIAYLVSGSEFLTPQDLAILRVKYGLDKPLYEQYIIYISQFLTGDLGVSTYYHIPTVELLGERLSNTVLLTVAAFILSLGGGLYLGIFSAKRVGSKIDTIITTLNLVLWSIPYFWLSMIFILIFSVQLDLFPISGMTDPGLKGVDSVLNLLWHLVLPVSVLGLGRLALWCRFGRSSLLEELHKDYIITARAKGCDENTVFYSHAFKNASLPIITLIGLKLNELISGSLLVEIVFGWPGLGMLSYEALSHRDYSLLMTTTFLFVTATLIGNLLADIAYAYVDPRIRYR